LFKNQSFRAFFRDFRFDAVPQARGGNAKRTSPDSAKPESFRWRAGKAVLLIILPIFSFAGLKKREYDAKVEKTSTQTT